MSDEASTMVGLKKAPSGEDAPYSQKVISFFDHEARWWEHVYQDDLPEGFFSYEMRKRLSVVVQLVTDWVQSLENPNFLECGCGPGDIFEKLAPLRCKLTGIDINPRFIGMAAQKVPNAKLIEGNAEDLPFPGECFDIVCAVGLLQYLDDDRKAASEIARVTKQGGIVLVTVPNYRMLHLLLDPYYLFRFIKNLFVRKRRPSNAGFDDSEMKRYPLGRVRRLFNDVGLREINSISVSFGPLRFWRREMLPLSLSIRLSEFMCNLSERTMFAGLKRVSNRFIITFRKEPSVFVKENP